ncbi:MAG: heme o synthase [Chloracidobacterium sp.]|uniref:Protoheme IX farnesyltransferase n=1 Tax=Chloracidobacterium validum TaxID=2821543 RepID=A0ABX8BCJ8_9BACT|nr:heme o synthase [Chloracidobacterium validum]QUW04643.1 heme o synthase [Chloracidobacterium validum]
MPKSVAFAAPTLTLAPGFRGRLAAYWALTKPRITFEVVLIAAFGFILGTPGAIDWLRFFHAMVGVGLLSGGIAALNQWMEHAADGKMRRTATRPIPSGQVTPFQALLFGITLTVAAEAYLCPTVNPLTAILGLITAIGYVWIYTPLKTRTWLSTAIGSFPGAMPPLVGWAAAAGTLSVEAWVLFAIMFFWQFPHFYAIAWMYREDYRRAGIGMLPVIEADGRRTIRQTLLTGVVTVGLSLLPFWLGLSGWVYLVGALLLGGLFLQSCLTLARTRTNLAAKRVLRASVVYLPMLFLLMTLNRL